MTSINQTEQGVMLKPCPFCGNHGYGPVFSCESGQWDIWEVECGFCDLSIETPHGLSGDAAKQAAVDRWNTRALSAQGVVEAVARWLCDKYGDHHWDVTGRAKWLKDATDMLAALTSGAVHDELTRS